MSLLFSVIVPTLNRKSMLRDALDSVRAQRWPRSEIIVVDGGSTDGTVAEVEAAPDVTLITEPDAGVYDALNKGIARARGDVVGALNSDDCYEAGAFRAFAEAFDRNPDSDGACGTAVLVDDDRVVAEFNSDRDKALTPRTALIGSSIINARMFRRSAIDKVGRFDVALRFTADRDWLTRWYEARLTSVPVRRAVYRYRQHAGSMTFTPDPERELAIRAEMIGLARRWRDNPMASFETRRVATFLEGRCVTKLARAAIERGDFAAAARWLLVSDNHYSLSPAFAAIRAAGDWVIARK